jgi:hypothetical protein
MLTNIKYYRKSKGGVWYRDGANKWTHAKTKEKAQAELEQLRALEPFGHAFLIEEIEHYV